jgi:hypothetical protein
MADNSRRRRARRKRAADNAAALKATETAPEDLETGAGIGPTKRALRERWPVREEVRPAIINAMALVSLNDNYRTRDRIMAARTVVDADKLNFTQETREAGGDTLNVTVQGEVNVNVVTDEQRQAALDKLYARLGRRPGSADSDGDRNGHRPILHRPPEVNGVNGGPPGPMASGSS